MPAIDIARLKSQASILVEKFDQPAAFLKELHEILDLYADRTLRMGVVAAPVTVLPAYRVSQAVLKQIEMELAPLASTFAEQAMALTDALWKDGYLETRLLAATLLGKINPDTDLMLERISAWVSRTRDKQLRTALLTTSLNRLRRESPDRFLALIRGWFDPSSLKMWGNAIYALIPLLEDPSYENLPPVYEIVKPALQNAPALLQNEIADLLTALYAASPIETTYFMRQLIGASTDPQTAMTFRRILTKLPETLRGAVQEEIRKKSGPLNR